MSELLAEMQEEYPGRWLCKDEDCRQPVESNPTLFLELDDEGGWSIVGVADNEANVTCTEGHSQVSEILDKSLSAYLEEQFPGCTWQGSDPQYREDNA